MSGEEVKLPFAGGSKQMDPRRAVAHEGTGKAQVEGGNNASHIEDNDEGPEYYTSPVEDWRDPLEGMKHANMLDGITPTTEKQYHTSHSINNAYESEAILQMSSSMQPPPRKRALSAERAPLLSRIDESLGRAPRLNPVQPTKPIPGYLITTQAAYQKNRNKNKAELPPPRVRQPLTPFAEPVRGRVQGKEAKTRKRRTSAPARSNRAPVPSMLPAPLTADPTVPGFQARPDPPSIELERQLKELQTRLVEMEDRNAGLEGKVKTLTQMKQENKKLAELEEENTELRTEIELLQSLQDDLEAQNSACYQRIHQLSDHATRMKKAEAEHHIELRKAWAKKEESWVVEKIRLMGGIFQFYDAQIIELHRELDLEKCRVEVLTDQKKMLKADSRLDQQNTQLESQLQAIIDETKRNFSQCQAELAQVKQELYRERDSAHLKSKEWALKYESKSKKYDALRKEYEQLRLEAGKLYRETHGNKGILSLEEKLRESKEKVRQWQLEYYEKVEICEKLREDQERLEEQSRELTACVKDYQSRKVETLDPDLEDDFKNLERELDHVKSQLNILKSENACLVGEIDELRHGASQPPPSSVDDKHPALKGLRKRQKEAWEQYEKRQMVLEELRRLNLKDRYPPRKENWNEILEQDQWQRWMKA